MQQNGTTICGMPQIRLVSALRAGINTVYFGQIERGQKCPTVDTLYKIAVGLEIPLPD